MIFDTWSGEGFGEVIQRPRLIEKRQPNIDYDPQAKAASVQPQEINPQSRWAIGLTGADHKPYAILHCVCKCDTSFELPGNGKAPKPNCCINAPAYPQDEFHQKHLWETGTGATGETGKWQKAPAGVAPEPGTGPNDVQRKPRLDRLTEHLTGAEATALTKMIDADIKALDKKQ